MLRVIIRPPGVFSYAGNCRDICPITKKLNAELPDLCSGPGDNPVLKHQGYR
jgi:hypothetical protein